MGQIGKLNSMSSTSHQAKSHFRGVKKSLNLLQNLLGQFLENTPGSTCSHDHPLSTLFSIDRETTHTTLPGRKSEMLPRDSTVALSYFQFCFFGFGFSL